MSVQVVPTYKLFDTGFIAGKWRLQHEEAPSTVEWLDHYWQSRGWESRDVVLEAVAKLAPTSVLEIGCHVGPMLDRIHERFPEITLHGIDVNQPALDSARQRLPGTFTCADFMSWLPQQPARSVDVVLSHYTLAYAAPGDIKAVLSQMHRLARRGVIIAEPMGPEKIIHSYPEWQHPYPQYLQDLGLVPFQLYPLVKGELKLNYVLCLPV